jgi:hypothetical protein
MTDSNVLSALLPYPNEDDFTSALAYLVDPRRRNGPEVLRWVLSLIPHLPQAFRFEDYTVSTQRTASSGRFDLLIRSPSLDPKTQVVIENKVELSLDDRSVESIQRYLEWLRSYRGTSYYLVLNTKYSIPEGAEIPEDVLVIHWHMIANRVKGYLFSLPSKDSDVFSKDFLEFLEAHDMGPLDQLNFQDGTAFRDFRTTNMKFDYVLDSIRSHFKPLGYKVNRDIGLTYEEPYYGVNLKKGDYSELFYNCIYFQDRKVGESRSLFFVTQIFIEEPKFYDFLESRYSELLPDILKGSEINFDDRYFWTMRKSLENTDYPDIESEKDDLLGFAVDGLKVYQNKLLPLLEKAAKQYKN